MEIPLSTLVTAACSAGVFVAGGYLALAKYVFNVKERMLDGKLEELDALKEKVHEFDVEFAKQAGQLKLIEQQHGQLVDDVRDIREQIVPRHEWEEHARRVDKQLEGILSELRRTGMRSLSPGTMRAVTDPPRPKDR